ncbi:MAG: hypothetical protein ACOCUA_03445 [archaeon]
MSDQLLPTSSSASAERRLLTGAVLLTMAAYTILGWSQSPSIPSGTWTYGGSLAVGAALAHLVVRRFAPDADPVLLNPGSHATPRGQRPGYATLVASEDGLAGTLREPDGTVVGRFSVPGLGRRSDRTRD